MKQFFAGTLVFAFVGLAGYLTYDFAPDRPITFAYTRGRPARNPVFFNPKSSPALRFPDSQFGRPSSFLSSPNQLSGGANSIFNAPNDLTKQLAGPTLQREITASEDECRDRLRQLGIVITTGPCADIGAIVEHLAKGEYSFNKPVTANMGEQFRLRLILQTADSQEQDISRSFGGLPGVVQQRTGSFAQSVEATLTGDDFEINPSGPQERTATLSHPVEWEWKLKPTSAGTKAMTIEVTANIQVGADKHRVQINTLHESILIQISLFQRLAAYLADANGFVVAAAALVTPLAVVIGVVPKVRQFFVNVFMRLRRRPTRATGRARRT